MDTPNPRNSPPTDGAVSGAQRAAAWVRREQLLRPFDLARDRYVARGEPAGRIRIDQPTTPERRLLGELLGRRKLLGPLIFTLSELDSALESSAFACSLVSLLEALAEAPILSRPAQRQARRSDEQAWRDELETILGEELKRAARPELVEGWGDGPGLSMLYRRFKSADAAERARAGSAFARCLAALGRLPYEPPIRLAVFATEVSGDPHAFDQAQIAGQLLTSALVYLDESADSDTGEDGGSGARPAAEKRSFVFERFGILTDTVWATVVAFNLAHALLQDGTPDPMVEAAGARVLNLSLRQLGRWRAVVPARPDVYVVENPSVFETLVDQLELDAARSGAVRLPSLVCTAGYPSQPAYRLLDLLVAGGAKRFWYSGDFDPEGLEIAAFVLRRYPMQARTWRFGAADYARAAESGTPAADERLRGLDRQVAIFRELVRAMRERRAWGYQEALIDSLMADLPRCSM